MTASQTIRARSSPEREHIHTYTYTQHTHTHTHTYAHARAYQGKAAAQGSGSESGEEGMQPAANDGSSEDEDYNDVGAGEYIACELLLAGPTWQ